MALLYGVAIALAIVGQTISQPLGSQDQLVVDLTSIPWTLQSRNVSLPARIPSQAHLTLLEAGVIDEPTYGDNDLQQAWIAIENFTYRSAELSNLSKSSGYSTHLVFDGIDTFANVSFCNQFIASVNNQFLQWEFDITDVLTACTSQPVIEVAFTAAPAVARALYIEEYTKAGNSCIPCLAIPFQYLGRQFIRKEQSDFGWDWAPGLSPQGIWQPARIVQAPKQEDQISVTQAYVDVYRQGQINNLQPNQDAPWVVNVSVDYFGSLSSDSGLSGRITNSSDDVFETITFSDIVHQPGRISGSAVLQNIPDLWWPSGHGNQTLYNLTISLLSPDTSVIATTEKRIGFRTIVLNQTPVTSEQLSKGIAAGHNWHFEVNGHEFYAKGSNLVPPDPFWPRVNRTMMEVLFTSAIAANQNMLRIWSSGIYLPDYAYDLADELGLFLWSEFQFSDAFHPNDTASLTKYADEASYQVRRINSHPSLALWCGGNELEIALLLAKVGAPALYNDTVANYESIFLDAILHAVFDNTRSISYMGSSINYGYASFDYNRTRPIEASYTPNGSYDGVTDFYNYDSTGAFDLSKYPVTRFIDEFGFPSHSSYQTYSKYFPEDQLSFNSSLMVHRNRHNQLLVSGLIQKVADVNPYKNAPNATTKATDSLLGLTDMGKAVTLYYPTPNKSNASANFSMQIYTTQLFQAEHIRSQIDFYRRGSGLPQRNLGCLYWQLNDIWAAPTWASMEVGGRWKLLHHAAAEAYSPVVIAPFRDQYNTLSISVTSDLWENVTGNASLTWYDWTGAKLDAGSEWSFNDKPVSVGVVNSTQIFNASQWQLPGPLHTAVAVLRTNVSTASGKNYSSERFYVPQALRDENSIKAFADPKLNITYNQDDEAFTITSQAVAAYVWIDHPLEAKGYFTRNGFWMLPGSQTVKFVSFANDSASTQNWQQNVTVHSIYDLTVS